MKGGGRYEIETKRFRVKHYMGPIIKVFEKAHICIPNRGFVIKHILGK